MVFLLSISALSFATANTREFSLNLKSRGITQLNISKGASVHINNDFFIPLHDVLIINVASVRKVMGLEELPAGQSIDLEFNRNGTYVICYSIQKHAGNMLDQCLQINVGGRNQV